MPSKVYAVLYRPAWDYSSVSHAVVEKNDLVDEEKNPAGIQCYDPVRMGDIIGQRYQVVSKLGHGGWCTVWLARDLQRFKWQTDRFVAIKVGLTGAHGRASMKSEGSELRILKHISFQARHVGHGGRQSVRTLLDSFSIESPIGSHLCLVFEPLQISLRTFRRLFVGEVLPIQLANAVARDILCALDFLHTKCRIVHCDIKDENIKDENIIFKFANRTRDRLLFERAQQELHDPSRVKRLQDRDIYIEDRKPNNMTEDLATCVLTDYDLSVIVQDGQKYTHDIQPGGLEAPEVLLRIPWSYSADIFNFGIFLCELIEQSPLFVQRGPKVYNSSRVQEALKRMMDYLGAPPITMLEQADIRAREWLIRHANDHRGPAEPKGFETYFSSVEGREKTRLIAFVKRMLVWNGDRRATAAELLEDPWLEKG